MSTSPPMSVSHQEQAEVIAGLLAYSQKAAQAIQRLVHDNCEGLERYANTAASLVPSDARSRFQELDKAPSPIHKHYVPSLLTVAALELRKETRHSLVLAWLLDPARSGELAQPFWRGLRDRLRLSQQGTPGSVNRREDALRYWPERLDGRLVIQPKRHGSEWKNIDVCARQFHQDGHYRFGLVIENKVVGTTPEQPRQLDRYFDLFCPKTEQHRTVFIFLTESGRVPRTAIHSHEYWHRLSWSDVAEILRDLADDPTLHLPSRLLALQYEDVIITEILRRGSLASRLQLIADLQSRFTDLDHADQAWRDYHDQICDVYASYYRRTR